MSERLGYKSRPFPRTDSSVGKQKPPADCSSVSTAHHQHQSKQDPAVGYFTHTAAGHSTCVTPRPRSHHRPAAEPQTVRTHPQPRACAPPPARSRRHNGIERCRPVPFNNNNSLYPHSAVHRMKYHEANFDHELYKDGFTRVFVEQQCPGLNAVWRSGNSYSVEYNLRCVSRIVMLLS
ncbi:hypothetical protein chiPu_0002121 [Chiloscyllium punctatum]|uniref:Uncharacterized protein n=1 Tax=Chiloscyllium punctatum TaxID=137246 RepID=A0A401RZZ4_CHIPU|nr:hypothetical protein [Chiloscyllium punctatum]